MDPIDRKIDNLVNDVKKLTNDIQTIKNDVNGLKDDMRSVKTAQGHIRRISAIVSCNVALLFLIFLTYYTQLYNRSQGSGDDTALEVVPFGNGDDPTKQPVRRSLFI